MPTLLDIARRKLRFVVSRRTAALPLLILLGLTSAAAAQTARLPADFPSRQDFSSADSAQIASFVSDNIALLSDADSSAASRARELLFEPLASASVTVPFRLEYAKALDAPLAALVGGNDPRLSAIALRLAGRTATAVSERALQKGLASSRPATRYATTVGYQELLRTLGEGALSLGDAATDRSLVFLRDAVAGERDPRVVDGIFLALDSVPRGAAASSLRLRAMLRVSEGGLALARRLRAQPPATDVQLWSTALLRALDATYQTMLAQMQAGAGSVSPEFAKASGSFAGQSLAYVRDHLARAQAAANAETNSLRMIVGAAENLVVLAEQVVNPNARTTSRKLQDALDQAIARGSAAAFADAAAPYIGPTGLLTKPPYSVKPEELAPAK